jgi:hypothetical protein
LGMSLTAKPGLDQEINAIEPVQRRSNADLRETRLMVPQYRR